MKFILLFFTLIAGVLPILKNIRDDVINKKNAKSSLKRTRYKRSIYGSILLLLILLVTLITNCVIQYKDDLKVKAESIIQKSYSNRIISGLKADTAELHKTNQKLEQIRDSLRNTLDKNSFEIARRICNSGDKLLGKIIATTSQLNDKITGGDAYCIGDIVNMGDGTYQLQFTNNFKNPIPNLIIKIENYSLIEACPFVIENGKNIYQYTCLERNTIQTPPTLYETNVPHLWGGSEPFISNNNIVGKLIIQFISPGYLSYQCYEEIIYRINGKAGGPVRYRIVKVINGKTIEVMHFNPNDKLLNNINWNEAFKNTFDMSYKKY